MPRKKFIGPRVTVELDEDQVELVRKIDELHRVGASGVMRMVLMEYGRAHGLLKSKFKDENSFQNLPSTPKPETSQTSLERGCHVERRPSINYEDNEI
jgi:hypothetical protein